MGIFTSPRKTTSKDICAVRQALMVIIGWATVLKVRLDTNQPEIKVQWPKLYTKSKLSKIFTGLG